MTDSNKIFLLGFMGSGKSTLGKKLANKLNVPFFDLDKIIEEQIGISIAEIFKTKGEEYFRTLETQVLKQLIYKQAKFVIATGGGAPCFNNNIELINESGTSIYLKYNEGILASRLINAKANRPLIANKTKEDLIVFITNLLKAREQFYLKSKIVVEGNNITANQITDLIFQNS
jgi:shikimate kinase